MTVTLSQDTYNALLDDLEKLRERNAELEKKAKVFGEIVNAIEESANSYELVARIKLEVLKYQKLERGSDES
ncbi:hypothetical protein [Staphylococcus haemolyticus]|uniref:hypothetical protein n=1 Tax=Staphylococcus haemolyticus TaxID=1283 RepID=UPI001F0A0F1C|nr:hypothetical protein [Staphylococcus haemolyticus]MCH4435698.1 hypothetical protein [Staphylococcus haemolyticus]